MKTEAELNISCQVKYGCDFPFKIDLLDKTGKRRATTIVKAWKNAQFLVGPGEYTIKIRSLCGLNPRGVIKWVRLCRGNNPDLSFVFTPPMSLVMLVPVNFTVEDANFPGITVLNGGIRVWRNKTIR